MKIVVLNECFLNESYLKRLKALGEVKVFPNTTNSEDAINRLNGADIAIVDGFLTPLNREVLSSVDKLKLLSLAHTSFSMVDLEAASQKNIKIANAPGFSKQAVAEQAIGLMFAVNRNLVLADKDFRQNPFEMDPGNKLQDKYWGYDLKGKTMGVVGLGNIGGTIARLGSALGMKVLGFNRSQKKIEGVKQVNLEQLLKESDVVIIAVPLNSETENMFSEKEFSLMKDTAILVNISYHKLIDEKALFKALVNKKIRGAGLDGPAGLKKDDPMLDLENIILMPHTGSFTEESFKENLPEIITSSVENFVRGTPINLVN